MEHQPYLTAYSPRPLSVSPPDMAMVGHHGVPLDYVYGMGDFGVQHNNITSVPQGGITPAPTSPPESSADLECDPNQDNLDPHLINAIIQNDFKNVKRRMQNREAQRRFRERKEQRQKTLQQKAEDSQFEYQKLTDQYTKRTDEVCRLLKENESLRSEVKSLRQRWRIMLHILERHEGSPSPSLQAGESPSPPSLCSGRLDDIWRCLEELTDEPHSPS